MAKIPFTLDAWLKDKSQKIETRNGRPVHYIGLDRAGWQVFEIFRKNGTSEYRTYHNSYMYCGPEESTYDLFIVMPEKELTEWEKTVKDRLWRTLEYSETFRKDEDKWVRKLAAELLAITKEECMNQIESDYREIIYGAYKKGRADVLKDLPMWKKCQENDPSACVYNCAKKEDSLLYYNGHTLRLIDLEKLPGFKEDESHE